MLTIILLIIIAIGLLTLIGSIVFYFKKDKFKRFYHDILGWHVPDDTLGFDGCSFCSTCKHCGKKIMMDSQGNWF